MSNNVPWVLDKLWELPRFRGLDRAATFHTLFPNLHMVQLVRRDRLRQAVSWARAAQDGVWVVSDTERATPAAEPAYDYEFTGNLERLLVEGEQGRPALCGELGVSPLTIYYEDLVNPASYEDVVRSVLEHLEVDATDVQIPTPRTNRRADAMNEDWVRRYRADGAVHGAGGRSTHRGDEV